ncbi:hypothetical protein B0I22_2226 [Epilithonimonas xixisoli]|uniref:Uncharacterized protein n=1 Tax=Epilithonimonas xixisoli TaxID=1476462 RepID=A0A4R8I6J9_9FLAO|nr:hypothetical protein B0I22_2226 [Epilithonimonas xixisoli]
MIQLKKSIASFLYFSNVNYIPKRHKKKVTLNFNNKSMNRYRQEEQTITEMWWFLFFIDFGEVINIF